MISTLHLEINNGETADAKLSFHVFAQIAPDTWTFTLVFASNGSEESWSDSGIVTAATRKESFWFHKTLEAMLDLIENWTRNDGLTPEAFLAEPENDWMTGFNKEDFNAANWDDTNL